MQGGLLNPTWRFIKRIPGKVDNWAESARLSKTVVEGIPGRGNGLSKSVAAYGQESRVTGAQRRWVHSTEPSGFC